MMNKTKTPALQLVKYVLVVPIFFLFVMANSMYAAQNGGKSEAGNNLSELPPQKKGEVEELFIVAESQPEFPGGESAMMKFLADNIRYPVIAQENGIQGRVVCDFMIMKDGSISNVNILQGVDPSLDAEVKRLISSMPKWKPGNQHGNAVNVRGVFPVVFRIQWDNPEDNPLTSEEKTNLFKSDLLDDLKKVEGMMILEEVVVVGYGITEQK